MATKLVLALANFVYSTRRRLLKNGRSIGLRGAKTSAAAIRGLLTISVRSSLILLKKISSSFESQHFLLAVATNNHEGHIHFCNHCWTIVLVWSHLGRGTTRQVREEWRERHGERKGYGRKRQERRKRQEKQCTFRRAFWNTFQRAFCRTFWTSKHDAIRIVMIRRPRQVETMSWTWWIMVADVISLLFSIGELMVCHAQSSHCGKTISRICYSSTCVNAWTWLCVTLLLHCDKGVILPVLWHTRYALRDGLYWSSSFLWRLKFNVNFIITKLRFIDYYWWVYGRCSYQWFRLVAGRKCLLTFRLW